MGMGMEGWGGVHKVQDFQLSIMNGGVVDLKVLWLQTVEKTG